MNHNRLLKPFDTPLSTPPFSSISLGDYAEAIDLGIARGKEEIEAICSNKARPDFENTIVALDRAGEDLDRALGLFYNLCEAESDDAMMELSLEVSPRLSAYSTEIILNETLWHRIKEVWEKRDSMSLNVEDRMLLDKTYERFDQSGANLEGEDRERYKAIIAELSELTTRFGQNVLKELNSYELWLTADDLDGLPEHLIAQAAAEAASRGREGEYRFTLAAPTYIPFLKYSTRRDLREKMYCMYSGRNMGGEYDNLSIIKRITALRLESARLLGSETMAGQKLKRTMAGSVNAVYNLLDNLREAYYPAMQRELTTLGAFASELEGKDITLMPWDYSYYNNKLKNETYSYDDEELRPYFELSNTIKGVFGLATRLYGLHFTQRDDIEVYHPDVQAWEVSDADGSYLGVLYTDFFPRETKR